MEPLIAESVSRLLAKFEKAAESGKSVDVFEYFGRYTMEVILASAFGRYKDIQSLKERDKLTEALATALGSIKETSTLDGALLKRWLCEWYAVHVSVLTTVCYVCVCMHVFMCNYMYVCTMYLVHCAWLMYCTPFLCRPLSMAVVYPPILSLQRQASGSMALRHKSCS